MFKNKGWLNLRQKALQTRSPLSASEESKQRTASVLENGSLLANLESSGRRVKRYYFACIISFQLAKKWFSQASLYIMDDDLDTAETRLSAGNSQFHKVLSFGCG